MLLDVTTFRNQFHPDSRPSARTVRTWCEKQQVPGIRIGGKWFIDTSVEVEINPSKQSVISKEEAEYQAKVKAHAAAILAELDENE